MAIEDVLLHSLACVTASKVASRLNILTLYPQAVGRDRRLYRLASCLQHFDFSSRVLHRLHLHELSTNNAMVKHDTAAVHQVACFAVMYIVSMIVTWPICSLVAIELVLVKVFV